MARRIRLATVLAVWLTVWAVSSAAAKTGLGPLRKATISGPGLDEPIDLSGRGYAPTDADMFAGQMGVLETDGVDGPEKARPDDLGPRYVVRFVYPLFEHGAHGIEREKVVVRQHLYPYALGGPWTYTPPGQLGGDADVSGLLAHGWQQPPDVLYDNLTLAWGLPAREQAAARNAAPRAPEWLWPGTLALVLVAGLACAVVLRRKALPRLPLRFARSRSRIPAADAVETGLRQPR
jgi:hypothetical protein